MTTSATKPRTQTGTPTATPTGTRATTPAGALSKARDVADVQSGVTRSANNRDSNRDSARDRSRGRKRPGRRAGRLGIRLGLRAGRRSGSQSTPPRAQPGGRHRAVQPGQRRQSTRAGRLSALNYLELCGLAATIHVVLVMAVIGATGGESSATLLALAVAPILTAVFVPHSRRHGWHRWLALLGLTLVVMPDLYLPVLLVADTWILHRFWVVEGGIRLPFRVPARAPVRVPRLRRTPSTAR